MADRWPIIEQLYHEALDRPEAERRAFLADRCRGDDVLRREVESLLRRASSAENFLEQAPRLDGAAIPSEPPLPPLTGRRVGEYVVQGEIGAGGMGVVYRAIDTKFNRPVAIKFLSGDCADPAARRRFQREAQAASSLNHPHILTVFDAGEVDGRQYLVTEFVDGGTLSDWERAAPRGWRDVVELLAGVADGLATAHAAGILHRDIKPENILTTTTGYAKLADFGIAKLHDASTDDDAAHTGAGTETRAGAVLGTVAYMSPEQALGRRLDARSDVFSFGVVLYEALSGRRPFTGASDVDLLRAIADQEPAPLADTAPPLLRTIVENALQKRPADRYQSMHDLVVDLRRVIRDGGEHSPAATARSDRRRATYQYAAIAALTIAAAVGAAEWRSRSRLSVASSNLGAVQYTQLTDFDSASQPALSPDGRILAFVRGPEAGVPVFAQASNIYLKQLPDGDAVPLTHDTRPIFAPRFSPDGTRIAYATLDGSGWTTWVVPVAGGEPRKLLANAAGASWIQERTPSGDRQPRLLFSYMTGRGITLAVASAAENRADQRLVFEEQGTMDHFSYLSPDGRYLLLAEMGFDGWQACRLAPFDGGSKGRKVGPQPSQCPSAAWSPDGAWMYFSADSGNGFHIWRQRFPDGTPEQITFGATDEEGIEVDRDGRSLLTAIGTRQSAIWIRDARGDRPITSEAYSFKPSFSPDGTTLYYLVRTALGTTVAHGTLWSVDVESGRRERLLPDFQMDQYDIARDGRHVVFVSSNDAGRPGVWLATLDGSVPARQLSSSRAVQAFFGADRDVFFSADQPGGAFVYRVKDDGSDVQQVMPQLVLFLYGVSPDGKYLAVWTGGPAESSANAVRLYPVDGGAPVTICAQHCAYRPGDSMPQAVSWSPDGKVLHLGLLGGSAVFAVPLPSGRSLPALPPDGLQSFEQAAAWPGVKQLPVPGAIPSPDRSVIAYAKVTAQRNIYRVRVP